MEQISRFLWKQMHVAASHTSPSLLCFVKSRHWLRKIVQITKDPEYSTQCHNTPIVLVTKHEKIKKKSLTTKLLWTLMLWEPPEQLFEFFAGEKLLTHAFRMSITSLYRFAIFNWKRWGSPLSLTPSCCKAKAQGYDQPEESGRRIKSGSRRWIFGGFDRYRFVSLSFFLCRTICRR